MLLEIERRFLVTGDGWQDHVAWVAELRQGYLLKREDGLTARVRLQRQGDEAQQSWLTFKAVPDAKAPVSARLEFEYPIPVADAEALLERSLWRVEKHRYGLLVPGGEWVLDVFTGENSPLVIAEVELKNPEADLSIPPWCGLEITGLHQLSNAALASHPFQTWTPEERQIVEPTLWVDSGS